MDLRQSRAPNCKPPVPPGAEALHLAYRAHAMRRAQRMCRKVNASHWAAEAQSVADFALWQQAVAYDATKGVPFWGFAYRRVMGAVWDMLRAARVIRRADAGASRGYIVESDYVPIPLLIAEDGSAEQTIPDKSVDVEALASHAWECKRVEALMRCALNPIEIDILRRLYWLEQEHRTILQQIEIKRSSGWVTYAHLNALQKLRRHVSNNPQALGLQLTAAGR